MLGLSDPRYPKTSLSVTQGNQFPIFLVKVTIGIGLGTQFDYRLG